MKGAKQEKSREIISRVGAWSRHEAAVVGPRGGGGQGEKGRVALSDGQGIGFQYKFPAGKAPLHECPCH